jgi:hypothetical protein
VRQFRVDLQARRETEQREKLKANKRKDKEAKLAKRRDRQEHVDELLGVPASSHADGAEGLDGAEGVDGGEGGEGGQGGEGGEGGEGVLGRGGSSSSRGSLRRKAGGRKGADGGGAPPAGPRGGLPPSPSSPSSALPSSALPAAAAAHGVGMTAEARAAAACAAAAEEQAAAGGEGGAGAGRRTTTVTVMRSKPGQLFGKPLDPSLTPHQQQKVPLIGDGITRVLPNFGPGGNRAKARERTHTVGNVNERFHYVKKRYDRLQRLHQILIMHAKGAPARAMADGRAWVRAASEQLRGAMRAAAAAGVGQAAPRESGEAGGADALGGEGGAEAEVPEGAGEGAVDGADGAGGAGGGSPLPKPPSWAAAVAEAAAHAQARREAPVKRPKMGAPVEGALTARELLAKKRVLAESAAGALAIKVRGS